MVEKSVATALFEVFFVRHIILVFSLLLFSFCSAKPTFLERVKAISMSTLSGSKESLDEIEKVTIEIAIQNLLTTEIIEYYWVTVTYF